MRLKIKMLYIFLWREVGARNPFLELRQHFNCLIILHFEYNQIMVTQSIRKTAILSAVLFCGTMTLSCQV